MPITKEDLTADIQAFEDADDAHALARVATNAAKANTASVTATEQALIDQAEAHFDQATSEAKASEDAAVADETAKSLAEDDAKAKLFADIETFASQQ